MLITAFKHTARVLSMRFSQKRFFKSSELHVKMTI